MTGGVKKINGTQNEGQLQGRVEWETGKEMGREGRKVVGGG